MVTLQTRVTLQGRLFRDPAATIRQGLHGVVQAIVEAGEQRLDTMLRPRPAGVYLSIEEARSRGFAGSTGHYRRNVHGKVTGLAGRIDDGGVEYGPWLEGVSARNLTTRFRGYHSFRRTAQWLRKNLREITGGAVGRLIERLR